MRPSSPNMDIVDMEEDSDDEDVEEVTVDKRPMAPPPVVAPPPINPEKVVIKANYDPKAAAPSMAAAAGGAPGVEEQMLISPLTGEREAGGQTTEAARPTRRCGQASRARGCAPRTGGPVRRGNNRGGAANVGRGPIGPP